jgi:hypothetical protein
MENAKSLEENPVGELLYSQNISWKRLRPKRGLRGDRQTADPLKMFV